MGKLLISKTASMLYTLRTFFYLLAAIFPPEEPKILIP